MFNCIILTRHTYIYIYGVYIPAKCCIVLDGRSSHMDDEAWLLSICCGYIK